MVTEIKVEWAELTAQQQSEFGNGCGPRLFPPAINRFITRRLWGWLFDASCRRHDFAYARGGSSLDRQSADRGFYRALRADAQRLSARAGRVAAKIFAWLYFVGVRLFGRFSFYYGPYRSKPELLDADHIGD